MHDLSRRLTNDFEVHVLAPSTPGAAAHELMDGVHVHRFRYFLRRFETLANVEGFLPALKTRPWQILLLPFFLSAEVWSLGRIARRYNVSLIHAHWIVPQGLAVWLAALLWRLEQPVVVTCHGADLFAFNKSRVFLYLKRKVLQKAAAVTVVSKAAAQQAIELGAQRNSLFVYPMGVDLERCFTPASDVEREPATLLFVGRLNRKKGVHVLLRAMALAREQMPHIKLEVVGYGPDEAALKKQAADLAIVDSIKFHGAVHQDALPGFYRRATCLVFPSVVAPSGDQEGLGLVPIEALGCGCAVIASRLPAVADTIEDGRTGWLFEPDNSRDLTDKIVYVLQHPLENQQSAVAGRAQVLYRNDWRKAAQGYAELLRRTLGNPDTSEAPSSAHRQDP